MTAQTNPLLPGYALNLALVAGLTRLEQGGEHDFAIDRPRGVPGYIISLTLEGAGEIHDGGHCFESMPGELLLLPPDTAQHYQRAASQSQWRHYWVYFRPRGFWAPWLNWQGGRGSNVRVGRIRLDAARIREFEQLFRQIDEIHRSGKSTAEELAYNALERLLLCAYEETPDYKGRHLDPRVQAACQFIAKHLDQDLSLQQIAEHTCLSASRLAHVFREHVGVNIVRWREEQRILLAKNLLRVPGKPISVIAARVGYDDHLYFSRVFRKRVGVSPSGYRSMTLMEGGMCHV